MQDHGVKIIELPNSDGKVDLHRLMRYLAEHEINELHVEAGATLNGALLEAGCGHELLMYLAPSLLGQGRDMFQIQPLTSLTQRHDLFFKNITQIGQSLRLLLGFASLRDAASWVPNQLRQVE
jgi:diaminohydroxyphosphoribosylaminopyrimidine deaminase/5-amino-6-(5-phosphoribosylamino)uracil reductase